MMAPLSLVDLGGISLLAGLGEEMLFRAVLQVWFGRCLENPALAILLAAILFGVVHAVNSTYAVLAALTGVYLGWVFYASGNLLAPVLAHALYDFAVLLYLMRGPGSDVELPPVGEDEEGEEGDEGD
jgi:membrane protease YdiL (CAAX protease family)